MVLGICRYVLNVSIKDACTSILKDCSAWKRICSRCCGSDGDDSGSEAAVALRNIGVFGNPKRFLYSEEMGEENRKAFLAIILKNEVRMQVYVTFCMLEFFLL